MAEPTAPMLAYREANSQRQRDTGATRWTIACDGPGCSSTIEATNAEAKRAGWARRWWAPGEGTGLRLQVDLCPSCRRGAWPPWKATDAGG